MSVKAQRPRSSSYVNLLQKQRSINNSTAADAGLARSSRIPGAGVAFQSTVKYDKKKTLGAKPLVDKRLTTNQDDGDDFLTTAYNNVIEENNFIKASLKKSLFKDGSTRAMTGPDGEPLDILNKGDDVNIEIDPKSKEGINNFISSMAMSESSNNSRSIRTNKDGKEFAGFLNMGKAVQDQYMNATGAEFDMDDFRDDPILQNEVALFHIGKLDQAISSIKNIPEKFNNINGLRAVGHLGGATGMKKFVESNGKYNPKDELGTSLMDYFNKFSKKGV